MSFRSLPRTADDLLAEILERLRRLELGVVSLPPAEMAGDHGSLGGLDDPDHDQYILHAVATAKGDLLAAPGTGVFGNLPVGADGEVLTADSAELLGVKWDAGGSGTGHMIKEDGTPLTARSALNFVEGVVATDNVGNDETDVNLDWAETGDLAAVALAAAAGAGLEVPRSNHVHAHGESYRGHHHVAITNVTSDYNATEADDVILADGTLTVTLPGAAVAMGHLFWVKNVGSGTVTVVGS